MSQENEARKKYLQVKTRATREMYQMKRTEANILCSEKKSVWISNKIKQIEETRKFFKEAQFLPMFCRDKSGNILSEDGDILQRWRQYLCDLQTMNARPEELILKIQF